MESNNVWVLNLFFLKGMIVPSMRKLEITKTDLIINIDLTQQDEATKSVLEDFVDTLYALKDNDRLFIFDDNRIISYNSIKDVPLIEINKQKIFIIIVTRQLHPLPAIEYHLSNKKYSAVLNKEVGLNYLFSIKDEIRDASYDEQYNFREGPSDKRVFKPTPFYHFELSTHGRTSLKKPKPTKEIAGTVGLFFATNRKSDDTSNTEKYYNSEFSDEMNYGTCKVNIPKDHKTGVLERPKWWKLEFNESMEKHIFLKEINQVDKNAFFGQITASLKNDPKKEGLFFIHGYNNNFSDCALRTAQIVFDIAFPGISGFYSWPSSGELGVTPYLHDLTTAELCITQLTNFIKDLLEKTGIEELHFIAHSMGSYILTNSLKALSTDEEMREKMKLIHQIILCAPDIDKKLFEKDIYPHFQNIGKARTIYVSDNDKALKLSKGVRQGLQRLGDSNGGDDMFVATNVHTIDATNVDTDLLGHGYFSDTKELINDIYYIILNELDPIKRRLKSKIHKEKSNLLSWYFPK